MDLTSLKDTVSNLSLYDLKAGVRKVQNGKFPGWGSCSCSASVAMLTDITIAVMNYTEMESKVVCTVPMPCAEH